MEIHARYGGVVPELASRRHIETVGFVVDEALKAAGKSLDDITAVAVTKGPGLIGSLLVGISYAKSIAYSKNIPLVAVNHLKGHIFAAMIENDVPYPFISLLVSGGHTALYLVKDHNDITLLGATRDDAAGEAFDNASKIVGLGYPGGIIIDRLSKSGRADFHKFPRAMISKNTFDFSFSGLKTSFRNYITGETNEYLEKNLSDIAASFQEAVVDVLVSKAFKAVDKYNVKGLVVSGGVAANSRLRERFYEAGEEKRVNVYIPSKALCTDNAAMIGVAGYLDLGSGTTEYLTLNALSRYYI